MFLDNIILLAVEFIPIIKNEIVRKYASAISTFRNLKNAYACSRHFSTTLLILTCLFQMAVNGIQFRIIVARKLFT